MVNFALQPCLMQLQKNLQPSLSSFPVADFAPLHLYHLDWLLPHPYFDYQITLPYSLKSIPLASNPETHPFFLAQLLLHFQECES